MRAREYFAVVLMLSATTVVNAADNELTAEEKAAGWQLLFNGKDLTGWTTNTNKPIASKVEDGALQPYKSGGYLIIHEKKFGDFILSCDVKTSGPSCNSGIFFRIGNPRIPVYTGLEAQVESNDDGGSPMHAFGAIYDLVPAKEAADKPPGEWNHVVLTCKGPLITVQVNGKEISKMNVDEFKDRGKRPDGSRHKFGVAVKDMARVGYIGFQDHGHPVWFKNVKILELKD
jgi:hypothetical protein